jgi:hypothetical protein
VKKTDSTTRLIIEFLCMHGHVAWRNHTTGIYDPRNRRWRQIAKRSRGIGDVIGCLRGGHHIEVEVKTGDDLPHEDQIAHRLRIEAAGGIYFLVDDFDDFHREYNARFAPRPITNPTIRHIQGGTK